MVWSRRWCLVIKKCKNEQNMGIKERALVPFIHLGEKQIWAQFLINLGHYTIEKFTLRHLLLKRDLSLSD